MLASYLLSILEMLSALGAAGKEEQEPFILAPRPLGTFIHWGNSQLGSYEHLLLCLLNYTHTERNMGYREKHFWQNAGY